MKKVFVLKNVILCVVLLVAMPTVVNTMTSVDTTDSRCKMFDSLNNAWKNEKECEKLGKFFGGG